MDPTPVDILRTIILTRLGEETSLYLETSDGVKITLERNPQGVSITIRHTSAALMQKECYQICEDGNLIITCKVAVPTRGGHVSIDYEKPAICIPPGTSDVCQDHLLHKKFRQSLTNIASTLRSVHTTPVKAAP